MQTAKAEQKRFVEYSDMYYTSSQETSVAGSDIISAQTAAQTAQQRMQAPGTTPQAKANKSITTRRTVFGKSTVSKPALKKLKSGSQK
jgi:hypothetical protein